jgi:hypothetical protein
MKRVALVLVTLGVLCLAAAPVQAGGYHHGHHNGYHGGYYGGYYGPVVVRAPVLVAPRVVVPAPIYPPVYRTRYYYPEPSYGFYYQGRGVSIGVGF